MCVLVFVALFAAVEVDIVLPKVEVASVSAFAFASICCGSQSAVPSSVGVAGKAVPATEKAPEFVGHAGAVFVGV